MTWILTLFAFASPALAGASDDALAESLVQTLQAADLSADIAVEVRNGEVTLIGRVPDVEARNEIVATVKSMQGVEHVRSELEVAGVGVPAVPDLVVEEPDLDLKVGDDRDAVVSNIKLDLIESVDVSPEGVIVSWDGDQLKLSGWVESANARRAAGRIARRHAEDVENDLRVVK